MKRVAVVGSGISGLAAAYGLRHQAHVTVFEADDRLGGHANTVDLTLDGQTFGVDTGFLVYNLRTYPRLIALFDELGVPTAPSDMSFSVQVPDQHLEWNGSTLNTVFAQRRNLLRPAFLRMLADIVRFNRITTALAERGAEAELDESIADFLQREGFSTAFRDWYFLPMIGCIWSCPTDQMLKFPVATMIRFCHNHGLIQVNNRPPWRTVAGGSREYVRRLHAHLLAAGCDVRTATPVQTIRRPRSGVELTTAEGTMAFDAIVLACHSDQSLRLLSDPTAQEQEILGAIRYHDNVAVLHTDASALPRRESARAAWNYERATDQGQEQARVCLHYLLNKLQPLPTRQPVVVSLNPVRPLREDCIHHTVRYAHPVFDRAAIAAQARVPSLQGQRNTWYCGAWTRYGFHEDGILSAQQILPALLPTLANGPWDAPVERAA